MSGAVARSGKSRNTKDRNRVEKVKVKRHFAGRSYSDEDEDDFEDDIGVFKRKERKKRTEKAVATMVVKKNRNIRENTNFVQPPLITIPEEKIVNLVSVEDQGISFIKEDGDSSSDEEDSSSSDEESSDEEEDILDSFSNSRFGYVSKSSRKNLVKSKEELKIEEEKKREEEFEKIKKRKEGTQLKLLKILIDEEKKKDEEDEDEDDEFEFLDDEDYEDENESEYDKWMDREKKRIMKYKTERYRDEKEKRDLENLRNLGKKEREELDRKLTLKNQKIREDLEMEKREGKSSFQFMQRFFKKGVFFQGEDDEGKEDDIHKRDFQTPTMQDKTNYKMLPKLLQNKYFGKKGNVKWTHLSNEDTTDWDSLRISKNRDNQRTGQKRKLDDVEFSNLNKRKRRKK